MLPSCCVLMKGTLHFIACKKGLGTSELKTYSWGVGGGATLC